MDKRTLIVFAREPRLGKVKTRLQTALSAAQVLRLYKAFLDDVLACARKVSCDRMFIYYAGQSGVVPFLGKYRRDFIIKRQQGADLGERMSRAMLSAKKNSGGKIVVLGTDCLTITPKDIDQAFLCLDCSDYVLGPSHDGGYYLIGARNPQQSVFRQISWSTEKVLAQTLSRIRALRQKAFLLTEKEDIDTVDNLHRLNNYRHGEKLFPQTYKLLKKMTQYFD